VPADVPRTGPNTRPGEKPPVMPELATENSAAGARAFAEFFIKTIDWGYATTSSTYMRHYFTKSCIGCLSTAVALDSAARAKHRFIGDRFHITSARDNGVGSIHTRHVFATFDVNSVEVLDRNGKFVDGEPALINFHELIDVSWKSGHWHIDGFTVQR
jgi:hypothetical protein